MTASPKSVGNYTGLYRAIVVDNEDPEHKVRVKARIRGMHDDDVLVEELPWCRVCTFPMGNLHGPIYIPAKGQPVYLMFEQGHVEFPVVIGGIFTGLDTRNETLEVDVAGDDWKIVEGQRVRVARDAKEYVAANETKIIGGQERLTCEAKHHVVSGRSSRESGSETCRTQGGRSSTIGASDELVVSGDTTATVMGQSDRMVGGDDTKDVVGVMRSTAYNASGAPLLENADLREAVNGFAKYVAKTILGVPGGQLKLDPVGLQTQLYSLVTCVIKAGGEVQIDSPLIRLGRGGVMPVALMPHVHISPFLGVATGPAIDLTGGFGIAMGVLSGPPTANLPEE